MKAKSPNSTTELIKTVVYAVLIAVLVRTFAYEPFNIPSGSMKPTLLIGDYLFVSKFSYGYSRYSLPFGLPLFNGRVWSGEPKRGDVAVFKYPGDKLGTDYIKRIVGLPGDRIQVKAGVLHINEQPVKLQWIGNFSDPDGVARQAIETLPNGVTHNILDLRSESKTPGDCEVADIASRRVDVDNTCVYVVPPGQYFGMGDNRDNSQDSRVWGFIPAENLVGRAEFIFFSTDGAYPWWQFWMWPFEIRYSRLLQAIR